MSYTIKAKVYNDDAEENEPRVSNFENVGRYESEREALRGLARLADPTYEGWPNRETWAVNLWLSNEEPLYRDVRSLVAVAFDDSDEANGLATAEEEISEYVEQMVLGDEPSANLATDLLTGAIGRVDWRSIVEGFRED